MAVGSNEPMVGASEVRKLEERVRDLERLFGRMTSCGGSGDGAGKETDLASACRAPAEGRFPMSRVAEVLGVSRSRLHARAAETSNPRGPLLRDRSLRTAACPPSSGRCPPDLRLSAHCRAAEQGTPRRRHRSDQPQACSSHPWSERADAEALHRPPETSPSSRQGGGHGIGPALVFGWSGDRPARSGEKVPVAFISDAFDREIIAHVAVAGAGISGSDVRDTRRDAVERRFSTDRAPIRSSIFPATAGAQTAKDTRNSAVVLVPVPCCAPKLDQP